jgi:hypothetical protein
MKTTLKTFTLFLSLFSIWGGVLAQELDSFKGENGKMGFKDKNGKVIVEPKYDGTWKFSEGLAMVLLNSKYGFIDTTGKEVIPPKYDDGKSFKNGFAVVGKGQLGKGTMFKFNGFYALIDKSGKEVTAFKYSFIYSFDAGFGTNIGGIWSNGDFKRNNNGLWGYIDSSGKEIFEPRYLYIDYEYPILEYNVIYCYANKKGTWVNTITGKELVPLSTEKYPANIDSEKKLLRISTHPNIIKNPKTWYFNVNGEEILE